MPALHRRNAKLGPRGTSSTRTSTESMESGTGRVPLTDRDFLEPYKQTPHPSQKAGNLSLPKSSRNNLFGLYTKSEVPERYQSSEEESSSSPEEEADSLFDTADIQGTDLDAEKDYSLEASMSKGEHTMDDEAITSSVVDTAIAITFFAAGRPRLIDITTIAPIQKRKRFDNNPNLAPHKPLISRYHSPVREVSVPPVPEVDEDLSPTLQPTHDSQAHSLPKRKESLSSFASKLSEETAVEPEHRRKAPSLEIRPTPTYLDYDPYLLSPPRLVSSLSTSSHNRRRSRGSSGSSGASMTTPTYIRGWKGLAKTLGTARQPSLQSGKGKRSGMIARGANERDGPSFIPPFPFEELGSPRMQIPVA